jgi:hypothetical protein
VVPTIEKNARLPENDRHAPLKNKQRLGCMNQSSFDCIFTRLLATPNNTQATAKGGDPGCMVAMHPAPLMSTENPCL